MRASAPWGRRPVGGALAPVADHRLGIWGLVRSGVWNSRMACLGLAGKEGITLERRDARGLTFSAATPARVMQPGISKRGKQNWHMAQPLRDGVRAAPSRILQSPITPPLRPPARAIPGRTLLEGKAQVGSRASPQLQGTSPGSRWGLLAVPVPVQPRGRPGEAAGGDGTQGPHRHHREGAGGGLIPPPGFGPWG